MDLEVIYETLFNRFLSADILQTAIKMQAEYLNLKSTDIRLDGLRIQINQLNQKES